MGKPMRMVLSILDEDDYSSLATFLPEDCDGDTDPLQMVAALVQCVVQFMVDTRRLKRPEEAAEFLGSVAETLKGAVIEADEDPAGQE